MVTLVACATRGGDGVAGTDCGAARGFEALGASSAAVEDAEVVRQSQVDGVTLERVSYDAAGVYAEVCQQDGAAASPPDLTLTAENEELFANGLIRSSAGDAVHNLVLFPNVETPVTGDILLGGEPIASYSAEQPVDDGCDRLPDQQGEVEVVACGATVVVEWSLGGADVAAEDDVRLVDAVVTEGAVAGEGDDLGFYLHSVANAEQGITVRFAFRRPTVGEVTAQVRSVMLETGRTVEIDQATPITVPAAVVQPSPSAE